MRKQKSNKTSSSIVSGLYPLPDKAFHTGSALLSESQMEPVAGEDVHPVSYFRPWTNWEIRLNGTFHSCPSRKHPSSWPQGTFLFHFLLYHYF